MKLSVAFRVSVATLFFMLSAMALFGQSERGTITGVVHDSSGAVVPNAKVTIVSQSTNVSLAMTTNDAGEYTAPSLQAGTFTVRIAKEGFRTSELRGLALDAAQTVRADATLEVGSSTQAIEVMASAVKLQTEDAKSSTIIQNKLVNDMPLVVGGA